MPGDPIGFVLVVKVGVMGWGQILCGPSERHDQIFATYNILLYFSYLNHVFYY